MSPVDAPNVQPADQIAWDGMFRQLAQYHAAHGHCHVPLRCRENPKLGGWLAEQIRLYHKSRLHPARQHDLECLGLEWDFGTSGPGLHRRNEDRWEQRFAELVAFQKKHGHLRVTLKSQTSAGLMHWRDNQRINQREGKMTPEHKTRLDAIGFEWVCPGRLPVSKEEYNEAAWERMFAQLLVFKEAHGHCQVPGGWNENPHLAKWVQRQRLKYKGPLKDEPALRPDRVARLDAIGFSWQSDKLHFKRGWEARFAELVAFKEQHGHLRVTKANQTAPGLMHWRDNQRLRLQSGAMPSDQKARLDAIGFEWVSSGTPRIVHPRSWEEAYDRLVAFKTTHGHIEEAAIVAEDPVLADWVRRQRTGRENGVLTFAQVSRLDALGFSWLTSEEARWQARYAQLAAYHETHGHCRVPKGDPSTPPGLASWLHDQRAFHRQGILSTHHRGQLDALGWLLPKPHSPPAPRLPRAPRPVATPTAESRLAELLAFKEQHGHLFITRQNQTSPGLAEWRHYQRHLHQQGRLHPEWKARLDAIGFPWDAPPRPPRASRPLGPTIWDQRFDELRTFLHVHGHIRIPKKSEEHKRLHGWVVSQRVYRRRGTLLPVHEERLNAIGFDWNPGAGIGTHPHSLSWDDRFQQLLDFKERHGHTRVQVRRGDYKVLGGWVVRQRHARHTGSLSEDRIRRLDDIDFEWNPQGGRGAVPFTPRGEVPSSDERYAELLAFHAKHGHADVPTKYPPNPRLGNWISNTRIAYRKGQLSPARIAQLDALGFVWKMGRWESRARPIWERRFAELLDFQARTGHANVPASFKDNPSLGAWVHNQRAKYSCGRLGEARAQRLDAIGFRWEIRQGRPRVTRSWDERYADLLAYRQQHGHPHLSRKDKAFSSLDVWVKAQRVKYHAGTLPPDRIDRLNAIGFAWIGLDAEWERNLIAWKAATVALGRPHSPSNQERPERRTLSQWERTQRRDYRHGRLNAFRLQRLKEAGFPLEACTPAR